MVPSEPGRSEAIERADQLAPTQLVCSNGFNSRLFTSSDWSRQLVDKLVCWFSVSARGNYHRHHHEQKGRLGLSGS